ncbi:hypothetical protein CMU79_10060 [Elizabethkingia anophelis]|nr:hypothetical protein [Elizabethkingia anophelis]
MEKKNELCTNPESLGQQNLRGIFIKEKQVADIRNIILNSGYEFTEEELKQVIIMLNAIIRLVIKEFLNH